MPNWTHERLIEVVKSIVESRVETKELSLPNNLRISDLEEGISYLSRTMPSNTKGNISKQASLVYNLRIVPWINGGCNPITQ